MIRADLESKVLRRCSAFMKTVGLDSVTSDGTNADLTDPLIEGYSSLGLVPSVPGSFTDADVALLVGNQYAQVVDIAELRCLQTCLSQWGDLWDAQVDRDKQMPSTARQALTEAIAGRLAYCQQQYGYGGNTASRYQIPLSPPIPCWPEYY